MTWLLLAVGSAVSAGLVSITVKAGMKNVDSNLGTFLRTLIVLVFTFIMVLIVGSLGAIIDIRPSEWIFIVASGVCTGLSWLSYFKALQIGDVNKVVPVDKMSTVLTMILAIIILGEPYWWLTFVSMGIMVTGTMLMISQIPHSKLRGMKFVSAASCGVFDPRGIRQMQECKHSCAWLIARGNKKKAVSQTNGQMWDENINDGKGNWRSSNLWLVYALLSLVFASLTSILAKLGMQSVDSNLGTFLRTIVVAVMAFLIVIWKKKFPEVKDMTKSNWIYLIISGFLTGISWLCYYGAIQVGNISIITPIDKLSIVVTIIFSYFMFGEKLNLKPFIGLVLLTAGTLLLLIKP